jgi:hypothetical protein
MSRIVLLLAVTVALLTLSIGCAGVYSKQEYGPNLMQQTSAFSVGSPITQAIASVGAPDSVYPADKQVLYVFKRLEGMQVLSVFGQVKKTDLVVITEDGLIKDVKAVPKGEGLAIISGFMAPVFEVD